ncbi:MAG: ABC transporter permease [Arcanobacterium sp.]|nr:ABC transporter permease [Arcanobacterium sp.]
MSAESSVTSEQTSVSPAQTPASTSNRLVNTPNAAKQKSKAAARGSLFKQGVAVFMSNKLAVAGLGILLLFTLFSFVGPYFWVTEQKLNDLSQVYLPISAEHPLGTDGVGFDQLGRLMEGGQTSIIIGLCAGLLATTIGTIWGAIAGFVGGWVDSAMMRIVDAMMAIPALFLFILIASMVTPTVPLLILTVGAFAWLNPARLVRGESLALRARDYIMAMRGMGGSPMRAVRTHIVRNAIGTVIVNATFQVADAILYVAYLSFLGLGVPPPAANWGGMLSDGMTEIYNGHWWLLFPPGLMIITLVVAFNFVGDGLRDAFEVRLRER